MTLTPFILVFLEVFGLVLILVFVILYVASQPSLILEMEHLTRQMNGLDPQSTAARELILPWVMRPAVLSLAMLYVALIVPIVEELLKPLGVWLFSRRLTSRAQGFALGALSGAAYALIETLGVSPQTTGWASLLLTRIGTDLLHITTSALMGAAIVSAIQGSKYLRLLGTYILSVSLHGLWNALAILYTFSALADITKEPNVLAGKQVPLSIGMGFLALLFLLTLVLSNRRMVNPLPGPAIEEPLS
jgi:RsiW-degrading membrane proteinase PrsW (M82 family)